MKLSKNQLAVLRIPQVVFMVLSVLAGAVVQTVFGAVTGNYKTIPTLLYKLICKTLGLKVVFNAASVPVVKDKQVWFVANHMANKDFAVLGSFLNGTFAGKGDMLRWPIIAQVCRSVKYIGLRRSREYNSESRGKIISNFNAGYNTIMFPEGTTTEGKKVHLFHAGLITALFGDKGLKERYAGWNNFLAFLHIKRPKKFDEVELKKEVVVQPVAIVVKEIEGRNAIGNDELRNVYSVPDTSLLGEVWKTMQTGSMTVEVTLLSPLDPKNFTDAKELINKAALDVAAIANPGQTTFEKAVIPGQKPKTQATTAPVAPVTPSAPA